jgi:hypothetical protein
MNGQILFWEKVLAVNKKRRPIIKFPGRWVCFEETVLKRLVKITVDVHMSLNPLAFLEGHTDGETPLF